LKNHGKEFNMEYKQLDPISIENKMTTKDFGKRVIYYEEIDSTNTAAKELGKQTGNHGALVLAEEQNQGKGRLGRDWSSPKGSGIFMTIVLQPQILPVHASMLTLVAALAVNQGIRKVTGLDSYIKWPNDIVVNGKKVCGILTEMSTMNDKLECVVIGMGINANRDVFPEELKKTATSLKLECKKEVERTELIVAIMEYLEQYYVLFGQTESFIDMVTEYNEVLINRNKQVRIIGAHKEYTGTALGINETGALLVQTEEQHQGITTSAIKTVVSGEVSVRGMYGYV
jgi:BirA family biotin operon repressor/biotin-[acetyl-CoA-carboxylase] ligase